MKTALISALLISSAASAQDFDIAALKSLMTERQASLLRVAPGMTKKVVTLGSFETESGEECNYKQTALQTIVKVEGENMIVFSQETFSPANSPACRNGGVQPEVSKVLFYDAVPTLAAELSVMDAFAETLASIERSGNLVTLKLNVTEEQEDGSTATDLATLQYDLSLPAFKNLLLNEGLGLKLSTSDMADVNPQGLDLTDVLFCDSDEEDAECVAGDYSDILFN